LFDLITFHMYFVTLCTIISYFITFRMKFAFSLLPHFWQSPRLYTQLTTAQSCTIRYSVGAHTIKPTSSQLLRHIAVRTFIHINTRTTTQIQRWRSQRAHSWGLSPKGHLVYLSLYPSWNVATVCIAASWLLHSTGSRWSQLQPHPSGSPTWSQVPF
jgi:hypothetical protein